MHEAYDDLPEATKERIDGLKAVHVYLSKYSPRALRPLSDQSSRQVPPPGVHPLVRTHPENGRKALYLNPVRIESIEGLEDEAALDLVAGLMAHAIQPKYEYRHQWRYGDFVIWDNRSVIQQGQPRLRHGRAPLPLPADAEGRAAGLSRRAMTGIAHRVVEANGIHMHLAEQGAGPLVLLCHGFPKSWYSWRHQLGALAAAGFHAVAPDMRGYGQTDRPDAIDQYTMLHLVGDMVGLLDALGAEQAVIAGHDWGAPVAWHAALLRPDRFRAVIGLSVPFRPGGGERPTTLMPQNETTLFYQLYFQAPGLAEADLERDVRLFIRGNLYANSGDNPRRAPGIVPAEAVGMVPRAGGLLPLYTSERAGPPIMPPWIGEADVDFYAGEFARTGFRGGLNYYRNIDRNWELLAPFAGARGDRAGAFHSRRPRSRHGVSRHGPARPRPPAARAAAAPDAGPAALRALDPAGASRPRSTPR